MKSLRHKVNASIAGRFAHRQAISSNIRVFHVSEYGISYESFKSLLAESYLKLPLDYYDVGYKVETFIRQHYEHLFKKVEQKWYELWDTLQMTASDIERIKEFWGQFSEVDQFELEKQLIEPFRRRSCFEYLVEETSEDYVWSITETGAPIFRQEVDDGRSRSRRFSAPPAQIYKHPIILKLMAVLAQLLVQNPSVKARRFKITLHQMLTYAKGEGANEPAPEGIHQDGADFIVSAIVVERVNVEGGTSLVYYSNSEQLERHKQIAVRYTLEPGQGIFQSDKFHDLWHAVTPISAVNPNAIAYRSMLGFDIQFLK